jgi:hypothetical protein
VALEGKFAQQSHTKPVVRRHFDAEGHALAAFTYKVAARAPFSRPSAQFRSRHLQSRAEGASAGALNLYTRKQATGIADDL